MLWRWCGFGGSVLLAAAAALAGAHPGGDPGAQFRTGGFPAVPATFTVGLVLWLVGAVVLTVAWWKLRITDLRGVLLTGALWALPLLLVAPLGSRDIYAYACQGWLWRHGQDPYTVGVAAGGCPWFESVPQIWWHTPTPYGPLAVAASGLAATPGKLLTAIIVLRLLALASIALLSWQVPRLAVLCGLSAAHAARLGVVTPLILIHGLSAAHNDLLVAALLATALTLAATLHAHTPITAPAARPTADLTISGKSSPSTDGIPQFPENRDDHGGGAGAGSAAEKAGAARTGGATGAGGAAGAADTGGAGEATGAGGAAGAADAGGATGATGEAGAGGAVDREGAGWGVALLVGLVVAGAVATKVTAIVVVPFALVLLGRRWVAGLAGAIGGFVALSAATGLGLGWVQALRGTGELAQWSSVPTAVGMTVGYLLRPFGIDAAGPIAIARVAGVVVLAALGIGLLIWAWRHRAGTRKIVLASGLALAATAILGPVFYPWYAIAPLAVLAASATEKRHWLAVATVICTFLTLPNGLGVPVLTKAVGAFAVTAALIVLVARRRRLGLAA